MRLAIFGSRTLCGRVVREAVAAKAKERNATQIVTAGEPDGVCHEARTVAREMSLPLTVHHLQPKERAAGKYHWRSVAVLSDCDFCQFFYDGKSKGTANEIKLAVKRGVPHDVVLMRTSVDTDAMARLVAKIRSEAT